MDGPQVIVRSLSRNQLQVIVPGGSHSLIMDEPPERGGDNLGPSPWDLFLAGLGG